MHFEFRAIESYITALDQNNRPNPEISSFLQSLEKETERIKTAFIKEVFGLQKDRLIELYIQYNQETVIKLLDRLGQFQHTDEILIVEYAKPLGLALEDILNFIEKRFSRYFNLDSKVPESYSAIVLEEIKLVLPTIELQLTEAMIEDALIRICLDPVKAFMNKTVRPVTYSKLLYFKEYVLELTELSQNDKINDQLLYSLLGYMNFNSGRYFNFCTDKIYQYIAGAETLETRLENLAYILKRINQAQIKPGFALEPGLPSIKEQLIIWIVEEISFLEKRQQLAFPFTSHKHGETKKSAKIPTKLSVGQLAFLFKILHELDIVVPKSNQEMIRFISDSFTSKKAGVISTESLKAKFYVPADNSIQTIKGLSIKILNHINKNYPVSLN